MSKRFLSGINVIGGTTLNGVTDAGVDTDKFIVLDSNGVIRYRTGDEILSDVGAVSTARTLSINGTSYDLSADRSWTISTSSSARSIQKFVATANQTTFTITGGYTVGLVDVYVNGVKLDNSGDFTATNGSTIVLTTGTLVNNIVEVYKYINAFTANNALRVSTYFTATAGQTTFAATYSLGLIDVFYNGSKLATSEYNASSGTSIVLNNACSVNDIIEIIAYNYSVGGFTGVSQTRTITINGTAYDLSADRAWTIDNASLGAQPQLNGTGLVRMTGTTVSYDNATYATQSYVTTAVSNLVNAAPSTLDTLNELATALGNDANFSTTVTTSIATKQPQLSGTGFVKISGTTISYDNSTYYLASNPNSYITLASLSVTAPLTYNNATGALNINQASSTVSGWLSYTDWVTFNGKLALTGGTLTGNLSFSQPVGLLFANGQYIKDNGLGGLFINSGAAVNITATSLTVSCASTFSGKANGNNVTLSSNGTAIEMYNTSGTVKNWQISSQTQNSQCIDFTPSTANGGTIYSTPILTIDGEQNRVGIGTGTSRPLTLFHTYSATDNLSTFQAGSSSYGIQLRFRHGSTLTGFINSNTTNIFSIYNTNSTEVLSVTPSGDVFHYGGTSNQGLWSYVQVGSTSGASSFNFDVEVGNEGGGGNIFKVEAAFAHYSGMGYNCLAEFYISTRQTSWQTTDVVRTDTALAGSFTASKPNDSTLRVTKNAGTYGGGGKYWIRVTKVTY